MENVKEKLEAFAALVQKDCKEYLHRYNLDCDANLRNAETSIKDGRKYTKIDVGTSGRFMVVNATGEIFGIKAYGVIHKGHFYGTLDTINARNWGR